MKHDPTQESILVKMPDDDPVIPGAVLSVHPQPERGRTSVQAAYALYPTGRPFLWESSGDPLDADALTDDDKYAVNKARAADVREMAVNLGVKPEEVEGADAGAIAAAQAAQAAAEAQGVGIVTPTPTPTPATPQKAAQAPAPAPDAAKEAATKPS